MQSEINPFRRSPLTWAGDLACRGLEIKMCEKLQINLDYCYGKLGGAVRRRFHVIIDNTKGEENRRALYNGPS